MKKIKCVAALTLLFFSLQTTAFGWGDTGHMTVAKIAFDSLSPAQQERVNELAGLIELQDKEYNYVTSACWMDDIRDFPMFEPIKDWHFITQRFIVNNAVADEPPPPVNAASVIRFLIGRIKSPTEPDLRKAYYLAELTHLVGDIHQPLHTVTRYTPEEPRGDLGGNFFLLAETAQRPNLHSYWDAAGGAFGFRDLRRPLSNSDQNKLQTFANSISSMFPRSGMTTEADNLDPMVWAQEGKALAIAQVYPGIVEHDVPSQTYQTNAQKVARRRIALAGYRLAALLKQAF